MATNPAGDKRPATTRRATYSTSNGERATYSTSAPTDDGLAFTRNVIAVILGVAIAVFIVAFASAVQHEAARPANSHVTVNVGTDNMRAANTEPASLTSEHTTSTSAAPVCKTQTFANGGEHTTCNDPGTFELSPNAKQANATSANDTSAADACDDTAPDAESCADGTNDDTASTCTEDMACWDCATMGNRQCDPVAAPAPSVPTEMATITYNPNFHDHKVTVSDSRGSWQQLISRLALLSCNGSRTVCSVRDMDTGRVGTADGLAIYAD